VREQGSGTFVAMPAERSATGILGFIMHAMPQDMTTPYTLHFLAGVRREAARHNLKIQWLNPQDEKNISRENMDAVLMICHPTEALALGLPPDMPHVLLFHHSPDFPCVCADDSGGIKLAIEHLLSLGHRNISYLAASELDSVSQQRVISYRAVLEKVGHSPNVKFLFNRRSLGSCKSGEVTMEAWLKEGWGQLGSTAILAHNDDTAIGIIKALTNYGLRVPEDVSVVGFDGTEISELCTPSLTTVKVPLQEIGEQAVKVLLEQMKNGVPSDPQKILLPVQLNSSESTAPAQILSR
jgi:DNA-binding LacI/PurR family transcriptional regulator